MAPLANISEDWVAYTKGSSITKSIPLSKAIFVLSHLFNSEISPLWVNDEEITAIMILLGYIQYEK